MRGKNSLELEFFELAGVMLLSLDSKGNVTHANLKTRTVLGVNEAQIVGKNWFEHFIPESERKELKGAFHQLIKGELGELKYHENPVLTVAGEERIIAWHNVYLKENGRIVGSLSAGEDITNRLKAENKLRTDLEASRHSQQKLLETQQEIIQSAKLAVVSRLASGVAHEISNPLTVLLQGVDYLIAQAGLSGDALDALLSMSDAVHRADSIVQGLLAYSAEQDLALSWEDSDKIVQEALQKVDYDLARNQTRVQSHFQRDLPKVHIDRQRMIQVFVHLFTNAIQSMPDGGTLSVRVEVSELGENDPGVGYRRSDPFHIGDRALKITIEDTGCGLPVENLGQVFDPFFSTRPFGQGAGLGLPIVKQIVEIHRGAIALSNLHKGGTSVKLLLPIRVSPGT